MVSGRREWIRGKFWAKKKLDDVPGSKKMKLFGGGKDEAWQAANQLAEYLDSPLRAARGAATQGEPPPPHNPAHALR